MSGVFKAWAAFTVAAFAVFLTLFLLLLPFELISAYQESKTYNRLTGAHTTTWDALWVELRVQDAPKKGTQ